ncbi:MAG: hypothetical protein HUK25_09110 [Treponema sp.]|nr:hypothetical protein [Treponema sp.]
MKKVFFILVTLNLGICFAQKVTSSQAGKKTAERCLKLAENYLRQGDMNSAFSQAELGLGYDDSISDLYYVKALCRQNMGATVQEVLELSETANDKNSWSGLNEKGNRILLADLLSDTGKYEKALDILDREPFVFSSDAEAVRIKSYYRIGTPDALEKARAKISTARRIYKGDVRFISLFYSFELSRILKGGKDYKPELKVLETADFLSAEMKNYNDLDSEIECASFFFKDGEEQIRALKAFDAANKKSFLFPVIALQSGLLSEEEAYERFFSYADEYTTYDVLNYFVSLITEDSVKARLYDRLNSYNGSIFRDEDGDMLSELQVVYERGRPQYIHFDCDNNGIEDIYCALDYGELLLCSIVPLGLELSYSEYPYIGRAVLLKDGSYSVFEYSKKSCEFCPVAFITPNILQIKEDSSEDEKNPFYFPIIKSDWNNPAQLDYLQAATFVKAESLERPGASVTYSLLSGNPVSAMYFSNERVFANAEFENGLPSVRYVDYDDDGLFETKELFSVITADNYELFADRDMNVIKASFPYFDFSEEVYLSGILIDRENDNVTEFQEYYREKGGKTSIWVSPDGRSETYIRYPQEEGKGLQEECIFVIGIDMEEVHVIKEDGIPVRVIGKDGEKFVKPGRSRKLYWVGEEGDFLLENEIVIKMESLEPGVVILIEKDDFSYKCIKMGNEIFVSCSLREIEEFENEVLEPAN